MKSASSEGTGAQFHTLRDSLNLSKTPNEAKSVLLALTEKRVSVSLPNKSYSFFKRFKIDFKYRGLEKKRQFRKEEACISGSQR